MVGQGGKLLIGVDLKKTTRVLDDAYNDAAGITADFNLNLISRMQSELGATVSPQDFSHCAFYNAALGRIEMHLVSRRDQTIELHDHQFELRQDERIHTENSYKYSREEFADLVAEAGFSVDRVWTDDQQLFSVHLCTVHGD